MWYNLLCVVILCFILVFLLMFLLMEIANLLKAGVCMSMPPTGSYYLFLCSLCRSGCCLLLLRSAAWVFCSGFDCGLAVSVLAVPAQVSSHQLPLVTSQPGQQSAVAGPARPSPCQHMAGLYTLLAHICISVFLYFCYCSF
jgi:hypothetical protein